jgi:hypothetical protein
MNKQVQHQAEGIVGDVTGAVVEGGKLSLAGLAKLASTLMKIGVGVPLVVGAGLGMATSKLTSPSLEDNRALEKRLELARIETMIRENKRKLQASAAKDIA